ncbi:ketopantoate reductase family protein [Clostridium estertheticum]|uniref:ketopantoate reductase family protein n=1 Tax=Clostridium estertheticum TaxID=238834 RepID=UPI001C7D9FEB|nr:2-dehydropantoate 2-reductase N-terminal domain-containing protein [Clostridium estertheticum]MBX4269626.1 ketopantoate reductase family protein [Clostridium estertheticum]WLC79498.1 ketopantoate reductase family protein [Clostridium estertheticum]
MKIMILGLGVIGTTYGYVFQKSGHLVEHFVRKSKRDNVAKIFNIKMLDGRYKNTGENRKDTYKVTLSQPNSNYDFILISVSMGKLEGAVKTLNENHISGTIILFNGTWEERTSIDKVMGDHKYILGYPVAGGSLKDSLLDCVLFDHIMIESENKANIDNYLTLSQLLISADIKAEVPFDMVEWIWLHMAINAGVITTASKYGDVSAIAQSARNIMNSASDLSEAVITIREAVKVVKARGVKLNHYNNELMAYKIPSKLAGIIMRHMFKTNELTRRIMELHSNMDDLIYVCKSVCDSGKELGVKTPFLSVKYEQYILKLRLI